MRERRETDSGTAPALTGPTNGPIGLGVRRGQTWMGSDTDGNFATGGECVKEEGMGLQGRKKEGVSLSRFFLSLPRCDC